MPLVFTGFFALWAWHRGGESLNTRDGGRWRCPANRFYAVFLAPIVKHGKRDMAEQAVAEKRLQLSERAARRIQALLKAEGAAGQRLRIAVTGGGCQGFQYNFTFDSERNADDVIFTRDGAEMVVDETSLDLLAGSEVDFVEDLVGSYFAVKNPNAKSSCGCGSSFSPV